jgi:hypothetical protein
MSSDVREQWKLNLSGREVHDVEREGDEGENGLASSMVTSKVKMKNWKWRARRLMRKEIKKTYGSDLYTS